jgi:hypothetical protein
MVAAGGFPASGPAGALVVGGVTLGAGRGGGAWRDVYNSMPNAPSRHRTPSVVFFLSIRRSLRLRILPAASGRDHRTRSLAESVRRKASWITSGASRQQEES